MTRLLRLSSRGQSMTLSVLFELRRLPDKSSAADPTPTNVLKQVVDLVAPFVAELFNRSPNTGHFPNVFRQAFITPIVKKPNPDATDRSYRPLLNLSVYSRLVYGLRSRTRLCFSRDDQATLAASRGPHTIRLVLARSSDSHRLRHT